MRIRRNFKTRLQRPASAYFRGAQDVVLFGENHNPYRQGTTEHQRYEDGYTDAALSRELNPKPHETLRGDTHQ